MQWDKFNRLWDEIANQSLWVGAAVVLAALVLFGASRLYKTKPQEQAIPDQRNGWMPTGRIDFSDLESTGSFILQAEDTRIIDSIGGVEHREIRWRKATLDEAKTVVVAYHAQRNLTTTVNLVVSSRNSDPRKFRVEEKPQEPELGKDEVAGRNSQG